MKRKIYKGGVDNYPLWWYGQSNRLQNFGDRPNFLTPHGAVFKGSGYYFDGNDDYMVDVYGRHFFREGTLGIWSYCYLVNSVDNEIPPCGSIVGSGSKLYLSHSTVPKIVGKVIAYQEFCPNLVFFTCYNNSVSKVDISRIISLTSFHCNSNLITTLDVSNNSKITALECQNNQMGQPAVDKVLCDANAWNTSGGTLDISGNTAPGQAGIDAKNDMVNNRGWTVTTD